MVPDVLNTPGELVRPSSACQGLASRVSSPLCLPPAGRLFLSDTISWRMHDSTCTRSAGLGLDRLFRPHFSSGSCSGFCSHSALPSDSFPPLGVCAFGVLTHISHVKDAPTQGPDPSVPGLPPHGKYLLLIKQSPGFRPHVACGGHGHSASGSPCRRRGDPVAGLLPLPR